MFATPRRTVICWAMGITQHRNAVATVKEFVNLALLQGNIGKPGAGLCPVRGHSNVQGDRTMGIWERAARALPRRAARRVRLRAAARARLRHASPRSRRCATATAKVFFGHGRQLRLRRAGHRGHRGRDAHRRPDRPRLHQAQPLPRRPPAARR